MIPTQQRALQCAETDVLLVDDDTDILTVTQVVLEGSGYSVRTATNGHEALALIDCGLKPSVILLDLMMPIATGWSFRDELARRSTEPPIVVLSGANLSEPQVQALHVCGCLRKPVDLFELLATVEHFCRAHVH
jgi:two-component system, chemotaxis family, chemotaxis protein CheY